MSLLDTASLIVTPNGYKESKLYSVIPSDGSGDLSVTRATTATRINSAGLVEFVPYNLITDSETYSSTWGSNFASITKNLVAPNGLTTGSTIVNSTGVNKSIFKTFSAVSGQTYQFSVYIKKISGSFSLSSAIQLTSWGTGVASQTYTNLGTTITTDWVRYTHTFTATSNNTVYIQLISNEVHNFGLWGAQLNEGSLKDYYPTTTRLNIPRLDYANGTCPSLLVEPQRTNLALYSEQLDNAYWTKVNATLSANSVVSPSGVQNADQVTFTSGGFVRFNQTPITPLTAYTISAWVKKPATGGANSIRITTNNTLAWNTGISQEYTLTTEWQRIVLSGNIISAGTGAYVIIGGVDATGATDTDAIGIVHIWGAQLELGAYATSYIPTTSASVTRNVDILQRTNVYTNGLITASGGTWYGEIKNNQALVRDASNYSFALKNATAFNSGIYLRQASGSAQRLVIAPYSSGSIPSGGAYTTLTDTVKFAAKWNGTSYNLFVNGVQVVSSIAYTPTQFEFLECPSGRDIPLFISAMALFPSPLTDAQCIALTTL